MTWSPLDDPVLDELTPDMTPVERLFTTIQDWDEDEYTTTLDRLDAGTRSMLESKSEGDGKYFSWDMISEKDAKEMSEKRIKEMGIDPSGDIAGKGLLFVTRKPGWKVIERKVIAARQG